MLPTLACALGIVISALGIRCLEPFFEPNSFGKLPSAQIRLVEGRGCALDGSAVGRGRGRPAQAGVCVHKLYGLSGKEGQSLNRRRAGLLCRRLLGRPAAESGRLRHGDGGHGRGDRAAGGS
jgi:hypothetical protein